MSEQGPRYDLIHMNNHAAQSERCRHMVTSLSDKLAAMTTRSATDRADNARLTARIASLEAENARLRAAGETVAIGLRIALDVPNEPDWAHSAFGALVAWSAALAGREGEG